jgi:hypothetical protein
MGGDERKRGREERSDWIREKEKPGKRGEGRRVGLIGDRIFLYGFTNFKINNSILNTKIFMNYLISYTNQSPNNSYVSSYIFNDIF